MLPPPSEFWRSSSDWNSASISCGLMHISKWFSLLLDVRLLGLSIRHGSTWRRKKNEKKKNISTFNVSSSIVAVVALGAESWPSRDSSTRPPAPLLSPPTFLLPAAAAVGPSLSIEAWQNPMAASPRAKRWKREGVGEERVSDRGQPPPHSATTTVQQQQHRTQPTTTAVHGPRRSG